MAEDVLEIEQIQEKMEESEKGIDQEKEKLDEIEDEEAKKELEDKYKALDEKLKELTDIIDGLKKYEKPKTSRTIVKFVVATAGAGLIFYFITYLLEKAMAVIDPDDSSGGGSSSGGGGSSSGSSEATETQQKLAKTTAISNLISSLQTTSGNLLDWMDENEDVNITLTGIQVPITDIYTQYMDQMDAALEDLYSVSAGLQSTENGVVTAVPPTTGQVTQIVDDCGNFISGLQDMYAFNNTQKDTYPALETLPITQDDLDTLVGQLYTLKQLPY